MKSLNYLNYFILISICFTHINIKATIINIPGDYPTIHQGIINSSNGDTILVQPGIYYEGIVIFNKSLTLTSLYLFEDDANYISSTVLDCSNFNSSVVRIELEPSDHVMINGFTIQEGSGSNYCGGGIYSYGGNVSIINNIITNNHIWAMWGSETHASINKAKNYTVKGGGIYHDGVTCYIKNNVIQDNIISGMCIDTYVGLECMGGGIYAIGAEISGNEIRSNEVDCEDIDWDWFGSAEAYAYGGGIYAESSNVFNNVIQGNSVDASAGALYLGDAYATAKAKGGGIYGASYSHNNLIIYNSCDASASATSTIGGNEIEVAQAFGGGLYNANNILNTTIVGNQVSSNITFGGGGVYAGSGKNCIIWNNIPNDNMVGFLYSWNYNPFFATGPDGSYYLSQTAAGQSQQSPCVNAGYPSTPLFLATTRTDEFPDMGIVDIGFHYPVDISQFLSGGFITYPLYGTTSDEINFYDTTTTSVIQIGSWSWDFQNDGLIDSEEQNPVWTYIESGIYTVRLVVTDTSGIFSDTVVKEDLITICNLAPGFYGTPYYGHVPLQVNFSDTSIIENTQLGAWNWDFQNDGNINSWVPNTYWIYEEPGIYSVELLITDTSGFISDSVIQADLIMVCDVDQDFIADNVYGPAPLEVQFTDMSTIYYTLLSNFQWDFDMDGIIDSYEQNPTWIFEEEGLYSVTYIVTDTSGLISDTLIKENYIEVYVSSIDDYYNTRDRLIIYPNPFTNAINVNYYSEITDHINIVLYDQSFKKIVEIPESKSIQQGDNHFILDVNNQLESGLYYIVISADSDKRYLKKVIKSN